MAHFFEHQLDYIFFFYGLAFIILGGICVIIRRDVVTRLPWLWMGLFGFSHGINEWLDMIAMSIPDNIVFAYFRLIIMALSFFFLLEFGRRGVTQLSGRKIGTWVYIPTGIIIVIGYLGGFDSLNSAIRYSMGLVGGLLAAWILWHASSNPTFKVVFRYAALFMALYAITTGFIVPRSSFLLAPFINHTSFFELTNLPIQLIRGILAILITIMLWYYYQSLTQLMLLKTDATTIRNREGIWISIALFLIILGGWIFTESISKHEEQDMKNEVIQQANILAASLNPEHITTLKGVESDMKLTDYAHIKEHLVDTIDSSPHIRWIKLVLLREHSYLSITFDDEDTIEKVSDTKSYADKISRVLDNGEALTIGPYKDKKGTFFSVFIPVRHHDNGNIIAALVMDVDAQGWAQRMAQHRILPILIVLLIAIVLISFFIIRQRLMESAQTLEKEGKELEEAQRIAHSGSWSWNIKTNELSWSNEVYHIFGLDPKLVTPDYNLFIDMVHPQDRESVKHAINDALYHNRSYDIEHRVVLPDGRIKFLNERGEAKYDADNNPVQLIGTTQDITERKQIEEALRENEEKYRVVSDFTYDWEYWQAPDKTFRYMSPSCEQHTGYSVKEFMGNTNLLSEIIHPDDSLVFREHFDNFKNTNTASEFDFRIISKNGSEHWISHICRPVYADNGEFLGRRVTNRDITERKLYERELREINATKDKFFSIVAHDLKNPFNALLGASEALNEGIEDFDKDEIKYLSGMVNKNAKNAYTLLENLLEWSRSQLGRIKFEPQDINLKDIAAESLKALEGQAKNKEINLINNNSEAVNIYADPNLLGTILRNLVSNAIKYTNNGGTITISSKQTDDGVEISVTDTGIGMSPDAIEQIFRIDTEYSTHGTAKETGTGLGLILCKEFVEKHGGRIWVESEAGMGSTFIFSIPVKKL